MRLLSLLLATALMYSGATTAKACALTELTPENAGLTFAGVGVASLGEADDVIHPRAWQGPLKTATCTVDIGIIEAPFYSAGTGRAFVTTYSGSMKTVLLVDIKGCQVQWKSAPFVGKVGAQGGKILLGDRTVSLHANCSPKR